MLKINDVGIWFFVYEQNSISEHIPFKKLLVFFSSLETKTYAMDL